MKKIVQQWLDNYMRNKGDRLDRLENQFFRQWLDNYMRNGAGKLRFEQEVKNLLDPMDTILVRFLLTGYLQLRDKGGPSLKEFPSPSLSIGELLKLSEIVEWCNNCMEFILGGDVPEALKADYDQMLRNFEFYKKKHEKFISLKVGKIGQFLASLTFCVRKGIVKRPQLEIEDFYIREVIKDPVDKNAPIEFGLAWWHGVLLAFKELGGKKLAQYKRNPEYKVFLRNKQTGHQLIIIAANSLEPVLKFLILEGKFGWFLKDYYC